MTSYREFLESRYPRLVDAGFSVDDAIVGEMLFPFQRKLVRWALRRGRAALFADTGLGKTPMQLEWARHVQKKTEGMVLIVAPLCVSQQTVAEGVKFGVTVEYVRVQPSCPGVYVTNYEMLDHFDMRSFSGVVLDESSIIKHHASKTRCALIDACVDVPYRLSCTATPAPNDFMELGNQAEFLGVMKAQEMLAMFFTHDGSNTSKWRLKGHGEAAFWKWAATWSMVIKKPSDIGCDDDGYNLPPLRFHEHICESPASDGLLFADVGSRLLDRIKARRESIDDRVEMCASIVNATDEQFVVWCHMNEESAKLASAIDGAVHVTGSDSIEVKEERIDAFTSGRARVLVTKPRIAGFGMNWQHVHNVAFVGLSDSWEQFYQAIRRCWRFGQRSPVDVHIVSAESEGAVLENIKRKERQAKEMNKRVVSLMADSMAGELDDSSRPVIAEPITDSHSGASWEIRHGDCIDVYRDMGDESVDYTVFSPPFAALYTYSNDVADMGNASGDDDFYRHFSYLVPELYRVTKSGRLLSFHCMNLPSTIVREGVIGLRDFRGELIRMFVDAGWIYHSEVCIWKDPVVAMQRTKALGLLYKQLKKDSCMSRQGLPDYVVTMRKPGTNPLPVTHAPKDYPVAKWQRMASPIWTDINQSDTLNKVRARDNGDERHICPLQLDVIERCLELWSRPGDLVSSPFMGIGSEGYMAVKMGRRFIGAELKRSYYNEAKRNMEMAVSTQVDMFGGDER